MRFVPCDTIFYSALLLALSMSRFRTVKADHPRTADDFVDDVEPRRLEYSLEHDEVVEINKEDIPEDYDDRNEPGVVSSSEITLNLSMLLDRHNLTAFMLAKMFLGTYSPADPADTNLIPRKGEDKDDWEFHANYWRAEVVTPVPQGVNGSLIQAVLYTNEYRNPENPQRVLSFAGVMARKFTKTINPESACLAAQYSYKGTEAEATWQKTCMELGYVFPNMTEWAAQAGALVQSTNATFLTGHLMGCDIAKSEGLLNPELPVVCWSSTGSLSEAWIDAYPGLADVIAADQASTTYENQTSDVEIARTAANQTSEAHPELYLPQNNQIYVVQPYTDPNSNCLVPPEKPGSGLAHVCAYAEQGRCDPYINHVLPSANVEKFEYEIFSKCVEYPNNVITLFYNEIFTVLDWECIPREQVGIELGLRDCPFQYAVYPEGEMNSTEPNSTEPGWIPRCFGQETSGAVSVRTIDSAFIFISSTLLIILTALITH